MSQWTITFQWKATLRNYCDPVFTWCDTLEQSGSLWKHSRHLGRQSYYGSSQDTWADNLTMEAVKTLVSSVVCSRINNCNTVFTGLPVSTTDCFDNALHAAAWLISGHHKYDDITLVRDRKLNWHLVQQWFEYKLFKALHGIAPGYIAGTYVSVSSHLSYHVYACPRPIRALFY